MTQVPKRLNESKAEELSKTPGECLLYRNNRGLRRPLCCKPCEDPNSIGPLPVSVATRQRISVLRNHTTIFKALSTAARVDIMEQLMNRRATMTQISRRVSKSEATVSEHLQVLEEAGIVLRIDDGHKWRYYRPTASFEHFLDRLPGPEIQHTRPTIAEPVLWQQRLSEFSRRRSLRPMKWRQRST